MIEFDVKCLSCKKLITLRVRDAQARVFFEEKGALCEGCYKVRTPARAQSGRRLASRRNSWRPCT